MNMILLMVASWLLAGLTFLAYRQALQVPASRSVAINQRTKKLQKSLRGATLVLTLLGLVFLVLNLA